MEAEALRERTERLLRGRFGDGIRVDAVLPLAGDASTRRYFRLTLLGAGVPATAVVMVLADRGIAVSSEELADLPETDELPFINVQRFLKRLGVAVPDLYAQDTAAGLVLLEDVGDDALREVIGRENAAGVERHFERAIDELLLLQLGGMRAADESCIAFRQAFDERLYVWEFEHFIEYGIERRLGTLPPAAAAKLRSIFSGIAARLARQPRVFTHRDFHAWNLFVQDGVIRVIDFQDALLAAAPYDLATLLGDRDTPSLIGPDMEERLLEYYRRRAKEDWNTSWERDHLREVYLLCALQKALKVVGRFHYLDLVKGKKGYLRYLPATVDRIEHLLGCVPEGGRLLHLLEPYLPRLA